MNILSNYIKSKVQKAFSAFLEDAEQGPLNIDLGAEELILKNVYLKASVINDYLLEVPFEITSGSIQTLVLKIPWTSLFSAPFEVFIDQPVINLALKDTAKENLFSKDKALEKLFEMFKSHVKQMIKADQNEGSWEIIRNIEQKIIDNLQVKIYQLLIRLECPTLITNPIFQVSMREFDFYTTDETYHNPAFFDRNLEMYKNVPISKLLRINDLILEIGDNSHPVRRIGAPEPGLGKKQQANDTDVFRFSLEVHGKIKTSAENQGKEPKYFASIDITTFKLMFLERQLDHAIKLSDSIKEFSRKLYYFYNFKLQKPHFRIEDKEKLGLDNLGYSVLIKRWWFYSITLVLKDMYVKKTENVWMHFLNRKKEVQTAKLPKFILVPFREPLRRIVQQLIDKDWKPEGVLKDSREVFDLETILLSLPEPQLKSLIKQACADIINREREKQKNKSFFLSVLSKLGLYKAKPNISELRRIIEENVVEEPVAAHDYTLKLEVKFHSWRIHVVTDYDSVFMIEIKGFSLVLDKFQERSLINFAFKRFAFTMQERPQGQPRQHRICFSQEADKNFIETTISIYSAGKVQNTDIDLKLRPIIVDVRKEIFDEMYYFMKARKSKRPANLVDEKDVPITVVNFEKALKNIKSDIHLRLDMASAVIGILLDERERTVLTLNSGNFKGNINILSSEKKNEYACALDNMQVIYTLHGRPNNIMDICIFGRSATAGLNKFTLELISKRIIFNFWPLIINDMKNNVLSFMAKNLRKPSDIPPVAVRQFAVRYLRGAPDSKAGLPPSQLNWDAALSCDVIFYDNKSVSIWDTKSFYLMSKIRDLKFTYFTKKDSYVLKVG